MFINHDYTSKNLLLVILLALIILFPLSFKGQVRGRVIERVSEKPIAFASIVYNDASSQKGFICDVHGMLEIKNPAVKSFTVSCMGYQSRTISIADELDPMDILVVLEVKINELDELRVRPEDNPAIRIIKNVLKNKDINNYDNYDKATYDCYLKTKMDFHYSGATAKDSVTINDRTDIDSRAPFLSECLFSYLQLGNQFEKKIIAQNTSGLTNPLFAQVAVSSFHSSISFYNNNISLFASPLSQDKSVDEFVSPLSDVCLKSYYFQLDKTYINPSDTVFLINFFPKRGMNFNSLKGQMFVSSNGYAIKSIVVEPAIKTLIGFKFKQDYELVDNKWFPSHLDEEIVLGSQKVNERVNVYPMYLVSSRISNVSFDKTIANQSVSRDRVYLDKISLLKSDSLIRVARPLALTDREKETFVFMDSLSERYSFDYWAGVIPKLSKGKFPIGKLDLNMSNLFAYNKHEGVRLGMGFSTNESLFKNVSFGGFLAYGMNDEEVKWGGDIVFDIDRYNDIKVKLSYQDNLKEVGTDVVDDHWGLSNDEYLRSFLSSRFDHCIEQQAELSFRTLRNLTVTTSLSLKKLTPTYDYLFKGASLKDYRNDELSLSLRYAYDEVLSRIGDERVVQKTGNPIINMTYTRGLNDFNSDSYTYNKLEATIDYTAYNGRTGQTDIRLAAGYIDESLPYALMFTGEGSKDDNFSTVINNSFQTMSVYEFLSDRYVSLFFTHNFGSLLFYSEYFQPQFIVVHNAGWGKLSNADDQGIDFLQKDKIYLESGIIVKDIIKLNIYNVLYFGLGIGAFYRHGYYTNEDFSDNLSLKLALRFTFK